MTPHQKIEDIKVEHVFIGSCTNSRMTDLRQAADMIKGKKVADSVRAIVVPGSQSVKLQAEKEGLDQIFLEAGFEWRESGCSMCLSMNNDVVPEESAVHQPLTATSRADKEKVQEHISSARQWLRWLPFTDTSLMSESFIRKKQLCKECARWNL